MIVLGIETSCDETSAAIVQEHSDPSQRILSNIVYSQIDDHKIHGGVVPEIAARAHLDKIEPIIKMAMDEAGVSYGDLDGVCATCGPGLIGGVMVGMMASKAIALAHKKPFISVNHLEGHALTPRLSDDVEFPYLLCLVSGGHTQLLIAYGVGDYQCLGTTLDDAAGECFDKSAKMMGLPYPGGPNLEKLATECEDQQAAIEKYPLPRPMKGRKSCDFSFSGLKTAVRTHIERIAESADGDTHILARHDMADLAYAFENAMQEIMDERIRRATDIFLDDPRVQANIHKGIIPTLVVAGGVAANKAIRSTLENLTQKQQMRFIAPPLKLCTDNGAMIGWAGLERLRLGQSNGFDAPAKPRWPLQELA